MSEKSVEGFDWMLQNSSVVKVRSAKEFFDGSSLFQVLLESVQDGVCVLDTDFSIKFVNTSMKNKYAREKSMIGKKCYSAFHGAKKICATCPSLQAKETAMPHAEVVSYRQEDGSEGFHQVFAMPVMNENDEVILMIEYVRDITFQKNVESDMSRLKERLCELETQNTFLMQMNDKRAEDKKELEHTIARNVERYVRPALAYLKKSVKSEDVEFVSGLFDEILYPVTKQRPERSARFTAREFQIAQMIRDGKASKEISDELCISKKTVDNVRISIRKKLKLSREENLQLYLSTHL